MRNIGYWQKETFLFETRTVFFLLNSVYVFVTYPFLYACETWSLTLREKSKLRVFENRVLRRIFGPGRDKVTGKWRRLHNEDLNGLYSSPNIIRAIKSRRIRWAGRVARTEERRGAYRVCVRRFDRKKPLGRQA